jgi:hypothetical protein
MNGANGVFLLPCCNYSGLLTTFGGSQEVVAAGVAACGGNARSKKTNARRWRWRVPWLRQTKMIDE